MKLYFYIVEPNYFADKLELRCEECEVIEKPKSYVPVTQWPDGVSRVNKSTIGGFVSNYSNIVVLDSKDHEKAKEVFFKKYDNELNTLRKRINFYEGLKSAIEDYKEDAKC